MIRDGQDPAAIDEAVQALRAGALVAFPTETVYGLGADASNDAAAAAIFKTKNRPADHPLIVHLSAGAKCEQMLSRFAQPLPPFALALARVFWPGPLTLIGTRQPGVATVAAGGHDTIGLRCPSHPVAQALLAACVEHGVPGLAAPSANRFGRVSPTTAAHVRDEFGEGLFILDGGACEIGIESTIVDCSRGAPVLLRPGAITRAQIEAACGERLHGREDLAALPTPRAPGTLAAHYAPRARLRLMDAKALQAGLELLGAQARQLAVWSRAPLQAVPAGVLLRRMPDDAAAAAHQLFAVLREFDAQGAQLIWVETPPATAEWEGVGDRLRRATMA